MIFDDSQKATTMNDDPYAQLAEEQISNPVKARMRGAKTRAERAKAKKLDDQQIQFGLWKKWHHKQTKKLLTGPYKTPAGTLSRFLANMTLQHDPELIELIKRGPWRDSDPDTRYLVLSLIDSRIVYLREAEGWPPFDDAMPFSDNKPTLFLCIREILGDG
jgi:hypothetical protein